MPTSNSFEELQNQFEKDFFTVNISLDQESDTSIEYSRYELVVTHRMTNSQWKVLRTYEDFFQLHQSIIRVLPALPSLPPREKYSLPTDFVPALALYLRLLIALCTASIWSFPTLLKFLDSQYGASPVNMLQIHEMSNKLNYLEDNLNVIASRNQYFMSSLIELSEKLLSFEIHQIPPQVSLSPKTNTSVRSSSNGGSINSSRNQHLVQPLLSLSQQSDADPHENPEFNWITSPKTVVTLDSDPSVTNSIMAPADNASVHSWQLKEIENTIFNAKAPEAPHVIQAIDYSLNTVRTPLNVKPTPNRVDNLRIQIEMPQIDESETAYCYDKSSLLAASSIPTNEEPNEIDEAVEEMIRILIPHEEQISYRHHVSQSLINFLRRSIGVIGVDTSFNAIKCTLPDDTFKLAIMNIKGTPGNWLQSVFDRLVRVSEGLSDLPLIDVGGMIIGQLPAFNDSVESILSLTEEEVLTPLPSVAQLNQFKIENVSTNLSASNEEHYVKLEINSIAMEIFENPRYELSFYSFIEEFAALVGRDYLLKRSLLLIRSWWYYETAAYIGCTMKHYLSDTALCVMICSVFNLYHHSIRTPFQALCIFLAEYSDFDWMSCVITLQGIISIRDNYDATSKNIDPYLRTPKEGHLITFELLLKYKMILANIIQPATTPRGGFVITNLNNSSSHALSTPIDNLAVVSAQTPRSGIATTNESSKTLPESSGRLSNSGSQKRFFPDTNDDLISPVSAATASTEYSSSGSSNCSDGPFSMSAYTPTYGAIPINTSNSSVLTNSGVAQIIPTQQLQPQSIPFEKLSLNILNPFTHGNMVSDKINLRRAKRVIKVFQMGARNIQSILTKADQKNVISSFFRNIQSRFNGGWRPDLFPKTSVNENITLPQACLIWANIPKSQELENMYKRGIFSNKCRTLQEQTWIWANYCNFLQEGIVNEIGVLTAVKEILIDRGTMPVGEIGKLLQEITNIPNISNRLKERYGGLKKFLEKYPEDFVVSTDHPFNPHVFLKKLMSAEDLGFINRGLVSPQLTSKIKKASMLAKKKTSGGLVGTVLTSNLMTNNSATVESSVTSNQIPHSYLPLSPKNYSNIPSADHRCGNNNVYSGSHRDTLQQIGFNRDISGMTATSSSPNLSVINQPQVGGSTSGYRAINRSGSLGSISSTVSSNMQMNQGVGRDFNRRRINMPVVPIQPGSIYRDSNSNGNNSSISNISIFHTNYHNLPDTNRDLHSVGGGSGMTIMMNSGNNPGMTMNNTTYQSRSSVSSSDTHGISTLHRGQGQNQSAAISQTDNLANLYTDRHRWNQFQTNDTNDFNSTGTSSPKLVSNRGNAIGRSSVSQGIGMNLGIGYSNSPSIANQQSSLLQGLGLGANTGSLQPKICNEINDGISFNIFQRFHGDDSELQEPPGLAINSPFGLQGQGLGSGQNLLNSFNRDSVNYPYPGAYADSKLLGSFQNSLDLLTSNTHSNQPIFSTPNLQSYAFNDSKNQQVNARIRTNSSN